MIGFLIRLIAYALVLALAARAAEGWWTARGLDTVADLAPLHDLALVVLRVAPIPLALLGGRLRPLAVFVVGLLAGATLTAPFALARLAAAG